MQKRCEFKKMTNLDEKRNGQNLVESFVLPIVQTIAIRIILDLLSSIFVEVKSF